MEFVQQPLPEKCDRPKSLDTKEFGTADEKRVRFVEEPTIYTVPSRDYFAEFHFEVWYSRGDFFVFKAEAIDDLRQFMRLHSITNADDALLIMYQSTPLAPKTAGASEAPMAS